MIERRVPCAGGFDDYIPEPQVEHDYRNSGPFYTRIFHEAEITTASIAAVPINKQKLLAGEYFKENHLFLRTLAGFGIVWAVATVTHSALDAWGSGVGSFLASEIPPLRNEIRDMKKEKLKEELMGKRALHFYNDQIDFKLVSDGLPAEVRADCTASGYPEYCPSGDLVDSIKKFPGLTIRKSRLSNAIKGSVNAGKFVGYMLSQFSDDGHLNHFIGDCYQPLQSLAKNFAMLPDKQDSGPLKEVTVEIETSIVSTSLGLYASFLALHRERVAAKITNYDCELQLGSGSAPQKSLDSILRDLHNGASPISWAQVKLYDQLIPEPYPSNGE